MKIHSFVTTSLLVLATLPALAASRTESLAVFRKYVQINQANAEKHLAQTSQVLVTVVDLANSAKKVSLLLDRNEDPNRGLTYDKVDDGTDYGDRELFRRFNQALNKEIADYHSCQSTKLHCPKVISEANYKVRFKADETLNGIAVSRYSLKPLRREPGSIVGDIWISKETSHVLRISGSAIAPYNIKIKFQRDYQESAEFGVSIPLLEHSVIHTPLGFFGSFESTRSYRNVRYSAPVP